MCLQILNGDVYRLFLMEIVNEKGANLLSDYNYGDNSYRCGNTFDSESRLAVCRVNMNDPPTLATSG